MANKTSNYTQLTKDRLKESVRILQAVINSCNACADSDIYWSQACRENGVEPLKTRRVILQLGKCVDGRPHLMDVELEDIYDPYEKFYRTVFGDQTIQSSALPYDYKETVLHVVNGTGLKERYSEVLTRRFGLGDSPAETLEQIGDSMQVTRGRIRQIEAEALRMCRYKERFDILKAGLAKYSLMEYQAQESYRQKMQHAREEHEALMAKRITEHKRYMDSIMAATYENAVMEVLTKDVKDQFSKLTIESLDLDIRSHNALMRNRVYSLFDLITLNTVKGRMRLRDEMGQHESNPVAGLKTELKALSHIGDKSIENIIERLEAYTMEKFTLTVEELRGFLLMPNKPDKE